MSNQQKSIIIGITGASGSIYALCLIQALLSLGQAVSVICTTNALKVLGIETDCKPSMSNSPSDIKSAFEQYFLAQGLTSEQISLLDIQDNKNLAAKCASGSNQAKAMIICPCSMGALGRIAYGISSDLLSRTADVALKERYPLIIVPRETPLNDIHLENMLKLSRMGVHIVPAMPAFYNHPQNIHDIVTYFVGRLLEILDIPNTLIKRW